MTNRTFEIKLDDVGIIRDAKYELSEVYSEIRKSFENSCVTDKSASSNELIFDMEKDDYKSKEMIRNIFEDLLNRYPEYRDYISAIISYYNNCRFVYDLSVETRKREMARLREKALHDEASALANAKNEGKAEAEADIIKKMKAYGMTEEQIKAVLSKG